MAFEKGRRCSKAYWAVSWWHSTTTNVKRNHSKISVKINWRTKSPIENATITNNTPNDGVAVHVSKWSNNISTAENQLYCIHIDHFICEFAQFPRKFDICDKILFNGFWRCGFFMHDHDRGVWNDLYHDRCYSNAKSNCWNFSKFIKNLQKQ